ncbi:uncharacterized protein LOC110461852 isoform X2 [Mizuhopecten yessoensis]|uniref:uncharacterized protein LOC110461852 isoform X2 n=1 Tax=Mizuhopecten yessoensis TaxID=6573 RepID=UPI000B45E9FE|nr:uncharacterized protein LOC110461852 isoform X2 [Mizuhopecten yessoensis]
MYYSDLPMLSSRQCQLRDWVTHKYTCVRQTEGNSTDRTPPKTDTLSTTDTRKQYRDDGTIFTDESGTAPSTRQSHHTPVNFDKALRRGKTDEQKHLDVCSPVDCGGSGSRTYLSDNIYMGDTPTPDLSQPYDQIIVKGNRDKQTVVIQGSWSGEDIFKVIASAVKIPMNKLKVIHKGKVMTSESIRSAIRPKAVFQVIGERAEDEDGLDKRDIEIMMAQLHVDRNEAILALKKKGDVIDALLHVGSK